MIQCDDTPCNADHWWQQRLDQFAIKAYRQSVNDALTVLETHTQFGLSEAETRIRLERHGRNKLTAQKPLPAWRKFLAQFHDPLIVLLLVATCISGGLWLYERDTALPYEAIAILAVVLLNAVMGYIQQSRAEQAVAALRQMSAARANVVRGGARQSIAAAEVVPGYAQTMALTTLVLFSLFTVFNARSDERSAFIDVVQQVAVGSGRILTRVAGGSDLRAISAEGVFHHASQRGRLARLCGGG